MRSIWASVARRTKRSRLASQTSSPKGVCSKRSSSRPAAFVLTSTMMVMASSSAAFPPIALFFGGTGRLPRGGLGAPMILVLRADAFDMRQPAALQLLQRTLGGQRDQRILFALPDVKREGNLEKVVQASAGPRLEPCDPKRFGCSHARLRDLVRRADGQRKISPPRASSSAAGRGRGLCNVVMLQFSVAEGEKSM